MRTFLAVAVLSGGVAHATMGPALRIADVAPDIPLIVVVMLAMRRGPEFGCGAGFLAGLLQDAATGGLLGVQALTKSVIGFEANPASDLLVLADGGGLIPVRFVVDRDPGGRLRVDVPDGLLDL